MKTIIIAIQIIAGSDNLLFIRSTIFISFIIFNSKRKHKVNGKVLKTIMSALKNYIKHTIPTSVQDAGRLS
ncbi:MAG: hypothetical protein ACI4A7_03665, partial [Prevotella sp.]